MFKNMNKVRSFLTRIWKEKNKSPVNPMLSPSDASSQMDVLQQNAQNIALQQNFQRNLGIPTIPYGSPYASALGLERVKAILSQQLPNYRSPYINAPLWSLVAGTIPYPPSVTPASVLPTALVAGPIVGYRSWKYNSNGHLVSLFHPSVWCLGQPMKSVCSSVIPGDRIFGRDNICPHETQCCGLYAFKHLREAACFTYTSMSIMPPTLIGSVAVWGRVIEHENGYRAQYAYPLALYLPSLPMPGFPSVRVDTIRKIAATYGIPALPWPTEDNKKGPEGPEEHDRR